MEIAEYCERMTGKPITEWQRKIMEEVVRNPNCQIVMVKHQKIPKIFAAANEVHGNEKTYDNIAIQEQ